MIAARGEGDEDEDEAWDESKGSRGGHGDLCQKGAP
jgi:hypothetical protein